MTYEDYYGFAQSPFTLAPDPHFLYLSASHEEAILLLQESVRRKEGFIVLTGEVGTGKTTIGRALLTQLDRTAFTSLILNPFLSVDELLRELLLDFGIVSRDDVRSGRVAAATTHELTSTLHQFLLSLVPIGGTAVLVIDEAQHLSAQLLEHIRVISNLETNTTRLLQIVLIGQPSLMDTLAQTDMRQLDSRISLRAVLTPLTRVEVEAYVAHRLQVARGSSVPRFSPDALDTLTALTGGVPRLINLACDRALMLGAQMTADEITTDMIAAAGRALGMTSLASTTGRAVSARRTPRTAWAGVAVAVLALLAAFAPLDKLVSATLPDLPARPSVATPPVLVARPLPPDDAVPPPPIRRPVVSPAF